MDLAGQTSTGLHVSLLHVLVRHALVRLDSLIGDLVFDTIYRIMGKFGDGF